MRACFLPRKIVKIFREYYYRRIFFHFGHNTFIDSRLQILHNTNYISIGNNVRFRYGARLETFPRVNSIKPLLKIGDGTTAETFIHIGACNSVIIGKNVLIGSNVLITDHHHAFDNTEQPIKDQGIISRGKVEIQDNCWIGDNVAILPNVIIGKNSVIGANSVVNINIPDNTVAAGNPVKIIRKIK